MEKKEISRRSFLKGTAAAGLTLAASGFLAACSSDSGSTATATETTGAAETETTAAAVEEAAAVETGVTSIGDWQLWDPETGELNLEGRDATGETAVVAAGTVQAAQAGVSILEAGGNAVDAAAAVAFAISVTEPQASGIGGGGFMTIRDSEGSIKFINFRETAPALAKENYWPVADDGSVVGNANMKGGRAIGVPGTVAGMALALEEYGTMSLPEVIQPAIDLCNNGFYIGPTTGSSLDDNYGDLVGYPEFGGIYLKDDGMNYTTGDLFKNTKQAKALQLIADRGTAGFYDGELQNAMISASNKYGGVFQTTDFTEYAADERTAVEGTYRGYKIYSSPLPSSGGLCIIQLLNILENFDLASMGIDSAEYMHVVLEAMKMVYADRSKYVGADTGDETVQAIMSKDYAAYLASQIDMDAVAEPASHDPFTYEHQDTTHFCVCDRDGNMVSCTFTINGYFGSKVAPDGYGFMLNNEMGDFSSDPESPNAIAPGKYPLSSMSPTIVTNEDGTPFAALGSPGGTTIIAAVALGIINLIDFGMDMQDAINQPRFYANTSGTLNYEERIDQSLIDKLEAMGYELNPGGEWNRNFGSIQGVLYADDGTLHGGADPRRDNKALGI